jgi:hypothetical protein
MDNANELATRLQQLPRFLHESYALALADAQPKHALQRWHVCYQHWLQDLPKPWGVRDASESSAAQQQPEDAAAASAAGPAPTRRPRQLKSAP